MWRPVKGDVCRLNMEIRPFCGIRYSKKIVGDLASVICPPYDVITPETQKCYYQRSNYNIIRLEYPCPENPELVSGSGLQPTEYPELVSGYKKAAAIFREWLERGILKFDDIPAFYLHDCYFTYLGVEKRRRGLIACLRLAPWGSGIYPHEETSLRDKSDRLQLMRACQANFSPLFCLYQDPEKEITSILSEAAQSNPIISSPLTGEDEGEGHQRHIVWAITESKLQQRLSTLSHQVSPVIMADGHHRYETALIYQQERTRLSPKSGSSQAFNYVMVSLVEFSDPGLFIFPVHRLVRSIKPLSHPSTDKVGGGEGLPLSCLINRLEDFFTLEFIPLVPRQIRWEVRRASSLNASIISSSRVRLSSRPSPDKVGGGEGLLSNRPERSEGPLGVLGLKHGYLALLRERQNVSLIDMLPANRSQVYQKFDISILNHVILDKILGLSIEEGNIAYTADAAEAQQRVESGECQLAFLVNPPQTKTIKAVADAGDRMPRKSTYFYPKMPAGLIINSLD